MNTMANPPPKEEEVGGTQPCKDGEHDWCIDRSWPEDPIVLCRKCGELKR